MTARRSLLVLAAALLGSAPAIGQTRDAATVVTAAEAAHESDVPAALRMVDAVLRLPRVPGDAAVRARALLDKCSWSDDSTVSLTVADEGLAEAGRARDLVRGAALRSCRGNALENLGRLDEAAADYSLMQHAAERAGDRRLLSKALAQSGYLLYARGDINDALGDLQKSYELARDIHYDEGRRLALSNIAHIYGDAAVGQFDKAIEYYQQLLPEYEASGEATETSDTLFNIGSTFERKGDLTSALMYYRRGLAAEERLGRKDDAAYVKRSIGVTLAKLGKAAEALPLFEEALQTFTQSGDTYSIAQVRQSRGIALRKLGRLAEAIADLQGSGSYFEETKNFRFMEKSQDELALSYAAAGRWQEAFAARSAQVALQRQLADKMREDHTTRMRVQFDTAKKEQDNRMLLRENAFRDKALEASARIRRLQTAVLVLGGLIILVLIDVVIRRIRYSERMRIMALTDELTRIANRRRILALGEEELQRARHTAAPFSLIAFDIDYFKRINDTWGHGAGDRVLQGIAHACRSALRPGDHLGRVGGEEFTVLLPATALSDAQQVAERLRATVESLDFSAIDPSLHVTISLGVAEWTSGDLTLARLTGRADDVLYRAKESGRNRVETAVA
jgi:diguanylate cyclase (GGDEF)-like protein